MKTAKISLYLVVYFLSLSTWGCKINPTVDKEDQAFENQDIPEEGMTISGNQLKDLNQSDIHFSAAIKAFENNRTAEVIKEINLGINALISEGTSLEGEPKTRLMKDINHLEAISVEIENGTFKDITKLQDALAAAEMAVAHEYASDMNVYSIKVPLPDNYYPHYKAALKAIMGAQKRMHGPAQKEAQKLLRESSKLLDRMDEGEEITEQEVRDQKAKMDAFLQANYHPSQST